MARAREAVVWRWVGIEFPYIPWFFRHTPRVEVTYRNGPADVIHVRRGEDPPFKVALLKGQTVAFDYLRYRRREKIVFYLMFEEPGGYTILYRIGDYDTFWKTWVQWVSREEHFRVLEEEPRREGPGAKAFEAALVIGGSAALGYAVGRERGALASVLATSMLYTALTARRAG